MNTTARLGMLMAALLCAHRAEAATATPQAGLIHLVSGDGLDRDAAATGNDRTGGMWENAGVGSRWSGYHPRWSDAPHRWSHYRHHRSY